MAASDWVRPAEQPPWACDLRHVAVIRMLVFEIDRLHATIPWLDCRNRPGATLVANLVSSFDCDADFPTAGQIVKICSHTTRCLTRMDIRQCRSCLESYPLTRDNFGNTPSGGFRFKCRACMRAHVEAYSAANKDGVAERAAVRREREARAGGIGYSNSDIAKVRRLLGDRCAYCDIPLNSAGHVDHMTPVAQGGKNEASNVTLCCEKCNLAKHAKNVEQFLRWRAERGLKNRNPRVV